MWSANEVDGGEVKGFLAADEGGGEVGGDAGSSQQRLWLAEFV